MKTERVTLLTTKDFKRFLEAEAQREGVSVGELIRVRCGGPSEEERLLQELAAQLRKEVKNTKAAIKKANTRIDRVLADLEKSRNSRRGPAEAA
jgi:ribosome recycling factor